MMFKKALISLTGVLTSFLITNQAIAGGAISGTVTGSRLKDPSNTIVYIEKVESNFEPPAEHAVMDQKGLLFVPHVLTILAGTTVDFPNSDMVRHHVFSPPGSAKTLNLGTFKIGETKEVLFDSIGEIPLLCNIHPEMSAYIVCLQNPYFAITGSTGTFSILDVPQGKYTLKTWHERMRPVSKEIKVTEGNTIKVDIVLKKRR